MSEVQGVGPLPAIATGQGFIGYFANNPVAANLMMGLMLVAGARGLRLTAQIFRPRPKVRSGSR